LHWTQPVFLRARRRP